MDRTQVVFTGLMLALVLAMWSWMAVGAWPVEGIRWRAELGDQRAIMEMYKRALKASDASEMANWGRRLKQPTQNDVMFMGAESRKAMKPLLEAQGKDTQLLDVLEK